MTLRAAIPALAERKQKEFGMTQPRPPAGAGRANNGKSQRGLRTGLRAPRTLKTNKQTKKKNSDCYLILFSFLA